MTNEDLAALFQQYGSVSSAKILNDKFTGRSKGFGFVEMENADEANAAISALNDSEIQGRQLWWRRWRIPQRRWRRWLSRWWRFQ